MCFGGQDWIIAVSMQLLCAFQCAWTISVKYSLNALYLFIHKRNNFDRKIKTMNAKEKELCKQKGSKWKDKDMPTTPIIGFFKDSSTIRWTTEK